MQLTQTTVCGEIRHPCLLAVRQTAGKLCGVVVAAVSPAATEQLLEELQAGFADHDVKKHKFELQDGNMAATGYILAQCMTGLLSFLLLVF